MLSQFKNESTDFLSDSQKLNDELHLMLPKYKKDNLNTRGQRKPLKAFQIDLMYRTVFSAKSFCRIASVYYRTRLSNANIIYLKNEVTNRVVSINLNVDLFGYITLTKYRDENGHDVLFSVEIPAPKFNTDLFIKILNKGLL